MFNNKFAERLKLIRKKYNLNQVQLSEILGVSSRAIQNYEAGAREPAFNVLIFISNYFFVSIDYLLGVTDDERYAENMMRVENLIIAELDEDIRNSYFENRPVGDLLQFLPLYIQGYISWNKADGLSRLEFKNDSDGNLIVRKVLE